MVYGSAPTFCAHSRRLPATSALPAAVAPATAASWAFSVVVRSSAGASFWLAITLSAVPFAVRVTPFAKRATPPGMALAVPTGSDTARPTARAFSSAAFPKAWV